jgi:hypothetical protein
MVAEIVVAVLLLVVLCSRSTDASWVDPDSPQQVRNTISLAKDDDRRYQLVFSDEFDQDGRTFHDGNDPRWTAMNKNDCTYRQQ